MKIQRREFLHLAAGAVTLPAVSRIASAQTFPLRPITIVVGYAAGGPTDTVARILAERMKAVLGQPVLVENTTGAGGSIAVGRVVRAAPDGYTLSMGDMGNYIANQALYPLQYDLRTDLQPIVMVMDTPSMVFSRKGMPAADLKELIAWLRANPNKRFAGTGATVITDVLSGQMDMAFEPISVMVGHVLEGKVIPLAVTSATRSPELPSVPTMIESGYPGFVGVNCSIKEDLHMAAVPVTIVGMMHYTDLSVGGGPIIPPPGGGGSPPGILGWSKSTFPHTSDLFSSRWWWR
jgi:tripartite-type tricarboxylate transporter receptor subunit TctC